MDIYFQLAYAVYSLAAVATLIYIAPKVVDQPNDVVWWGWFIIIPTLIGLAVLWPIFWLIELGLKLFNK